MFTQKKIAYFVWLGFWRATGISRHLRIIEAADLNGRDTVAARLARSQFSGRAARPRRPSKHYAGGNLRFPMDHIAG
jgi:hypothetical protein